MRWSLIPRDQRFYALLDRGTANLVEAAGILRQTLAAEIDGPLLLQRIRELEKRGDGITHEMMTALNKTFVTPLDREDLALLAKKIDDVVDLIWSASVRIKVYRINRATELALRLAILLEEQSQQIERAVSFLENRSRMKEILPLVAVVNRIEHEADEILREALGTVFSGVTAVGDLVLAVQWREVYEYLEQATDRGEDVGDVLESIVLKYA